MGCTSSTPVSKQNNPTASAPAPILKPKQMEQTPEPAPATPLSQLEHAVKEHAAEIQAALITNGPALAAAAFAMMGNDGGATTESESGATTKTESPSLLADVGSIASSAATGDVPSMGALARVGSAAAKAAVSAAKSASSQDSPLNPRDTIGSYDADNVDDDDDSPEQTDKETNIERPSEFVGDVPLMRYGQLKKRSGGMLVKNWRRRNFTVEKGILKYFEMFINEYPFGEREKGVLSLKGYTVQDKDATQVLLKSSERASLDLFLEANDEAKKAAWIAIFIEHIAYANKHSVAAPKSSDDAKLFKTSTRF